MIPPPRSSCSYWKVILSGLKKESEWVFHSGLKYKPKGQKLALNYLVALWTEKVT